MAPLRTQDCRWPSVRPFQASGLGEGLLVCACGVVGRRSCWFTCLGVLLAAGGGTIEGARLKVINGATTVASIDNNGLINAACTSTSSGPNSVVTFNWCAVLCCGGCGHPCVASRGLTT